MTPARKQVWVQISNQAYDQICFHTKVCNQIWDRVYYQIQNPVRDQVRDKVWDKVWVQVLNKVQ